MQTTRARCRRAAGRGFTLIEVLIVLAIVLALSAIVGLALFRRQDDAQLQLAQQDLNTIKRAMGFFRLDTGRYPTDEEGVAVLWDGELFETDAEPSPWKGPYLQEALPTDRWGSPWGYRAESEHERDFDLWSFGPDKEEDTDDDITSWASAGEGEADLGGLDPSGAAAPRGPVNP